MDRIKMEHAMAKIMICAALVVLCTLSDVAAAPMKLASGGKALVRIVVADKPGRFDGFAAEDLKKYLGGMAGAEFTVVNESDLAAGEAAIYIGNTKTAEKHSLSSEKFDREEWQIRSVDDKSVVVTGGRPIGAFYGAWSLLNHFGCYALTWDQDAVPNVPELTYDGFEERRKPSFSSRMIFDNLPGQIRGAGCAQDVLNAYYRWILRNGIGGRQNAHPVPYYLGGAFNMTQQPQYHSMCSFVPEDKYFKDHPEYYWMQEDGTRRASLQNGYFGGLCLSNPDVLRIATETMLDLIKKDRANIPQENWPTVYDFSRMDASPYFCKCPSCRKIEDEEGSQMGLFYRFLNQMAAVVKKEYPDVVIRTFGSWNTSDKPDRTIPMDNILIWVCDNFTQSDCFRPLTHKVNEAARKEFTLKFKDGRQFMVWDYWNIGGKDFFDPPRVETNFDAIHADLRFFHGMGANAMFIESELDPHAPQNFMPLCYFVAAQLMMNLEADPEQLADSFISYYYGPAADAMRGWFREIRDGVAKDPARHVSSGGRQWEYCTPEFLYKSYAMLKGAMASIPEDSIHRRRLGYELDTVLWCILSSRYVNEKCFRQNGVDFDSLYDECRALTKSFITRYGGTETKHAALFADFEERFDGVAMRFPIPDKFKDVPRDRIRFLTYQNFKSKQPYGVSVVEDPDATLGKAVCAAHESPDYHGFDKVIEDSGKYKFKTTYFEVSGATLTIKEAEAPDEKYHWYRMEGKAVFRPNTASFWGQ
ncbi:MAG: DUF4838 domain-containing protein, partial [Victivallales bacterium]|nr:DUF4838 domain-containing protein [Victivallales bacterium]